MQTFKMLVLSIADCAQSSWDYKQLFKELSRSCSDLWTAAPKGCDSIGWLQKQNNFDIYFCAFVWQCDVLSALFCAHVGKPQTGVNSV